MLQVSTRHWLNMGLTTGPGLATAQWLSLRLQVLAAAVVALVAAMAVASHEHWGLPAAPHHGCLPNFGTVQASVCGLILVIAFLHNAVRSCRVSSQGLKSPHVRHPVQEAFWNSKEYKDVLPSVHVYYRQPRAVYGTFFIDLKERRTFRAAVV